MLSPRLGLILKHQREKENTVVADNSFHGAARRVLEPRFGWGHAQFKNDLADEIEALKIDPSWRPNDVLRYVAKLVRDS